MAVSGDRVLERAAAHGPRDAGRVSGTERPDPEVRRAGPPRGRLLVLGLHRLDALVAHRARSARRALRRGRPPRLLRRYRREVALALQWLGAQEHQRFFLLQQNEASDWADIMPRSGFVLYTNALWYRVKRLFGLPNAAATRANFNGLFHPFSAGLAEYRRARLLNDYVLEARAQPRPAT